MVLKGGIPVKRFQHIGKAVLSLSLAAMLSLSVSAVEDITEADTFSPAKGMEVVTETASAGEDRPQTLYTVTASAADWTPAIGGTVYGKQLVQDAAPIGVDGDAVAAINGDHFSFKTGVPLGMSISGGRLITSPIPPYNADDYYFHALGITADGTVLTGENPTLYMQAESGETIITVDRLNRTRESWEGGQVVLFTPDYGESTDTDYTGVEYIIRVDDGEVAAGQKLKGTIIEENWDNDSPLEDGTVVLSMHMMAYVGIEPLVVGDEVSFLFTFEEEEWNDVQFAVGGNLTAVENGEAVTFDYTVGAFTGAAPRSAFGVREDGSYVLAAVDGRSDISTGLTANEMATYLADELDCEYAILLDGGGSTALAIDGETVNVPSEERPVGNVLLLVHTPGQRVAVAGVGLSTDTILWIVCGVVCVAAVIFVVVSLMPKRRKDTPETGEND